MAPFAYNDALLLDQATRVQAEVSGLDRYIADSQVLAKQSGGRRYRKSKRRGRKAQRGGELAEFSSSYELLPPGAVRGVNPQFHTEGSVNHLYGEHKGAQA
jgi:hypothetical protein